MASLTDTDPAFQPAIRKARPRALALWLLAVAALVLAIVAVGGITRLTESGVSITEWKPVVGTLPPMSEDAWQAEFDAYRATPQFQRINGPAGMTLETYKFIYFWEWVHRLLARAIGTALIFVTAWFWVRREIPAGYKPRLLALIALIGLQGAIGWWMVESGIVDDVKVSHFRLAVHLLTALLTMAGLVWTARDLMALDRDASARPARLTPLSIVVIAILVLQLLLGAWVAGLRAGLASDTWPLMQGRLFPEANWNNGIWWAFTHDPFLIHWLHRWWAWVLVAALVVMGRALKTAGDRRASIYVHTAFGTQILLGIATVMTGVALWLAVAHQLVGALLVAAVAWGANGLGRRSGVRPRA